MDRTIVIGLINHLAKYGTPPHIGFQSFFQLDTNGGSIVKSRTCFHQSMQSCPLCLRWAVQSQMGCSWRLWNLARRNRKAQSQTLKYRGRMPCRYVGIECNMRNHIHGTRRLSLYCRMSAHVRNQVRLLHVATMACWWESCVKFIWMRSYTWRAAKLVWSHIQGWLGSYIELIFMGMT